jgi:hypothetical protein
MSEINQWIYGALTILFIGLFYTIREIVDMKKKQDTMEATINTTLPMISAQLDELNKTVKLFLKQEIDTLKDIAKSNRDRNNKESEDDE